MARKPKTIDEYMATVSDDKRTALEKLRRTNHCAFYPMSSTTVEAFKKELKGYDTSAGTIRFQAD